MTQFTQIFKDDTRLGHKIPTSEYLTSGKYPIIDQGKHFISGYRNEKNGLYTDIPAIIFGDHTRILKYINVPFFIGADGVKILKPKIDNCNYKYLYYALCNIKIPNTGYNRHFKWLKEANITIPKLNIQNKVVNILDHINNIIQLREQQLSKLDQLVKSRFFEMFGDMGGNSNNWPEIPLREVCQTPDDIKCGPFGTQLSKSEYQSSGIPIWGIPQINSSFNKYATDFISELKANDLSQYSLISGDIAMSRKGNIGMCALYPDNFPSGIMHSDILRIRVNKSKFHPIFLLMQLRYSTKIKNQIDVVSSGAIMAGINVTKLKNILLYMPPLPLQKQFADFAQQVDKVKSPVKQSLEELETLKKSLMQEYFG